MTLALPFIDAHHHFWDLDANPYPWLQGEDVPNFRYGDYSAIKRNYLPADFRRDTEGFTPATTVHMEAEWNRRTPVDETRWLTGLARSGLPGAVVAHAALDADDAAEVLGAQAAFPLVRGIRHKPVVSRTLEEARRGQPGSMDCERWRRGYALLAGHRLSLDLQAPWWNLDQARDLARDFPATPLIVNHTGLPADRSEQGLRGWRQALDRLASQPNANLKISGLGLPGRPWLQEDNVPVIRDAISIFGVQRCMFASNFPVDSLVADYGTILSGFRAAIADRPQADQIQLLHDNAARIYRL